jgi:hypothetical protein
MPIYIPFLDDPNQSELPGADLVRAGLRDIAEGQDTVESWLVKIGAPRLRGLGIDAPLTTDPEDLPEHRLYHLLAESDSDSAHGRYNALVRRQVGQLRESRLMREDAEAARVERFMTELDVAAMVAKGLVDKKELWRLFGEIEPWLFRYPAIDPVAFRQNIASFVASEVDEYGQEEP